jgi:hypothetical protein
MTDITHLGPDDPGYPVPVGSRGPADRGPRLMLRGDPRLLRGSLDALFCSIRPPADLVLRVIDAANWLSREGAVAIGGFHSPVERLMLETLLGTGARIVIFSPRALPTVRVAGKWSRAISERRLLLASAVDGRRRADATLAIARNRLVASLAHRITVIHATPGGRVEQVVREAVDRGVPVRCAEHPENAGLRLLGARTVDFRAAALASR